MPDPIAVDPLLETHRELRAALYLNIRELRNLTMTPRRKRLLELSDRTLNEAKSAAVACGVSKIPQKASLRQLSSTYKEHR
jgi:hypothetical protein